MLTEYKYLACRTKIYNVIVLLEKMNKHGEGLQV